MSDPRMPYGHDPYAQQPYADQWYAQQGYESPYGQPSYGPPGVPYAPAETGSAVAALVCNIVAVALCCNLLAIPGIVTAAMAMSKAQTEPHRVRGLTIWSWAILGAAIFLEILLFAVLIIIGASADSSSPDYSTGTSGI